MGLEPTTLRLRVSCSTDWASRATTFLQKLKSFVIVGRQLWSERSGYHGCKVTNFRTFFFQVIEVLLLRKKSKEVSRIAGLSKGKRGKKPSYGSSFGSCVTEAHAAVYVCVHMPKENVLKEKMCMHATERYWQLSRERQILNVHFAEFICKEMKKK